MNNRDPPHLTTWLGLSFLFSLHFPPLLCENHLKFAEQTLWGAHISLPGQIWRLPSWETDTGSGSGWKEESGQSRRPRVLLTKASVAASLWWQLVALQLGPRDF